MKFYLDIYCSPDISYQSSINQGDPVDCDDVDGFIEKVFDFLYFDYIKNQNDEISDVLKITCPFIISNLIALYSNILADARLKKSGLDVVYTDKNIIDSKIGKRCLSPYYLPDLYSDGKEVPFVDFYLSEIYNKKDYKYFLKKIFIFFSKKEQVVVLNRNKWLIEFLNNSNIKYSIIDFEYFFNEIKADDIVKFDDPRLNSFIDNISKNISQITSAEIDKDKFYNLLVAILRKIVYKGYIDYKNCKNAMKSKKIYFNKIFTGTMGNYKSRVIFSVLKNFGVETNSCMHSGSISHIDYKFDPRLYIEYLIPNNFYIFNKFDIETIHKRVDKYGLNIQFKCLKTKKSIGCSSNKEHVVVEGKNIKKIGILSSNLWVNRRAIFNPSDLQYFEFKYKLLKLIGEDYEVCIKSHPKGALRPKDKVLSLFNNVSYVDECPMDKFLESVDCVITPFADSTSFNEVVSSNTPLILINLCKAGLTSEAKETLKNRVAFVDCSFENGLAIINKDQFTEAFNRKYIMDFEFANRFQ